MGRPAGRPVHVREPQSEPLTPLPNTPTQPTRRTTKRRFCVGSSGDAAAERAFGDACGGLEMRALGP